MVAHAFYPSRDSQISEIEVSLLYITSSVRQAGTMGSSFSKRSKHKRKEKLVFLLELNTNLMLKIKKDFMRLEV